MQNILINLNKLREINPNFSFVDGKKYGCCFFDYQIFALFCLKKCKMHMFSNVETLALERNDSVSRKLITNPYLRAQGIEQLLSITPNSNRMLKHRLYILASPYYQTGRGIFAKSHNYKDALSYFYNSLKILKKSKFSYLIHLGIIIKLEGYIFLCKYPIIANSIKLILRKS